jgi:hypothetical protein
MKVGIIGAGIYGCHIAAVLIEHGFDISIYEQKSSIFEMASGNNQFRLHLGFHYARDYNTRQQSKLGFGHFLKRYEKFTKSFVNNLYIIPKYDSLIDYKTYLAIFRHEDYLMEVLEPSEFDFLENTEGVVSVDERVILISELKQHFSTLLREHINFNTTINKEMLEQFCLDFDYVIDCTWGKLMPSEDLFFEVTHLGYYRNINQKYLNYGLTYVDGSLCSLYPTEIEDVFSLSSVSYTPLFKSEILDEANSFMQDIKEDVLVENTEKMEVQMQKYFPSFREHFKLEGHQISMKSKIKGLNDPRDCRISKKGNLISIFSGKIDTLYIAEEYILNTVL